MCTVALEEVRAGDSSPKLGGSAPLPAQTPRKGHTEGGAESECLEEMTSHKPN